MPRCCPAGRSHSGRNERCAAEPIATSSGGLGRDFWIYFAVADFAPYLLFGLILGAIVNRADQRGPMLRTEFPRGLVIACCPRPTGTRAVLRRRHAAATGPTRPTGWRRRTAAVPGLGMLFSINTGALRQALVPLLGRVIPVAAVLAWSAIPLGSLAGATIINATGDVAAVYVGTGLLRAAIAWGFALSPIRHGGRLPAEASASGPSASASALSASALSASASSNSWASGAETR